MLSRLDKIPNGWRLASSQDVSKYEKEAREAISGRWAICTLLDGKIKGSGHKFEVEMGGVKDTELGCKLVTNLGPGKFYTDDRTGESKNHEMKLLKE